MIQNNPDLSLIVFNLLPVGLKKIPKLFSVQPLIDTSHYSGRGLGGLQLIFVNFVKPYLLASPLQRTTCLFIVMKIGVAILHQFTFASLLGPAATLS